MHFTIIASAKATQDWKTAGQTCHALNYRYNFEQLCLQVIYDWARKSTKTSFILGPQGSAKEPLQTKLPSGNTIGGARDEGRQAPFEGRLATVSDSCRKVVDSLNISTTVCNANQSHCENLESKQDAAGTWPMLLGTTVAHGFTTRRLTTGYPPAGEQV
jgi:hypothetical protein